ncbi:MAG: hypothetical protein ACRDL6_01045 [Solirubrobacterales bacterium]
MTIGSNLGRAIDSGDDCGLGCTYGQADLPAASLAPGGVASPVNGTVVRWRIKSGNEVSPVALRVIRPPYLGAGTSATVTPTLNAVSTFLAQLPIQIGDRIGIDCCDNAGGEYLVSNAGVSDYWEPPLADGSATPPTNPPDPRTRREIAVNADIEPTSTFTLEKRKPKKKARVKLVATLPNPGTFEAGDRLAVGIGHVAAAKTKKKRKLLKRAAAPVGAAGQIPLVLKPTKTAIKLLKRKAEKKGKKNVRIKAKIRIAFTPTFGSPSVQVVKVKLKR